MSEIKITTTTMYEIEQEALLDVITHAFNEGREQGHHLTINNNYHRILGSDLHEENRIFAAAILRRWVTNV